MYSLTLSCGLSILCPNHLSTKKKKNNFLFCKQFLEVIKLENIGNCQEDTILPRDMFLLQVSILLSVPVHIILNYGGIGVYDHWLVCVFFCVDN